MKSKVSLTLTDPDDETVEFIAGKVRKAYLAEFDAALEKAQRALRAGRPVTVFTKRVRIEVETL
jgi:hypothetical protein